MKVAVIGLGKMGCAVAIRLQRAGHDVYGCDVDPDVLKIAQQEGINTIATIADIARYAISIVWILVPAGTIVDTVIEQLIPLLPAESIIVDGGNSHFTDSIRRAERLTQSGIYFVDCGTSGGLHGKDFGFSLMIGAQEHVYRMIEPLAAAIAMKDGYGRVGPEGAGHYVKMIHNGIEYALLQAYAEGFQLLKEGAYSNLDLHQIGSIWQHGSIIRSWILDLTCTILKQDQTFASIVGSIAESGTGQWTVQEARDRNVPVAVIEQALAVRAWSRGSGGNYATKLVALLRHAFGGHAIQKRKV